MCMTFLDLFQTLCKRCNLPPCTPRPWVRVGNPARVQKPKSAKCTGKKQKQTEKIKTTDTVLKLDFFVQKFNHKIL